LGHLGLLWDDFYFVSHTILLDACQERKTAGVSRKKAKKYDGGVGPYLSLEIIVQCSRFLKCEKYIRPIKCLCFR
jgi:hypothetical protein